ncbi:hypothetical protein FB384_000357 [Prauserella sediminis]|uniref:Uncharacterized protein n=1 Tax=Prauserella sediminis TaxID=577680 RepID=A0A839XL40_9PSEU|nr:hypothetical protein [Prauserella sediminis]MBB3661453.1 hypothetical protein [Prauserella sediminis]
MSTPLFGGQDETDDERLARILGPGAPAGTAPPSGTTPPDGTIFPRMVPAAVDLHELGWEYATSMLQGTLTLYVHDLPDMYRYLGSDTVARYDPEELFDAAMSNLRAAPVDGPEQLGHDVWMMTGDHAGALALLLPEVLSQCTGRDEFRHGALMATPVNSALLYHVPAGPDLAVALEQLAGMAADAFARDERTRVTPAVYWWDGGDRIEQVTDVGGDEITVHLDGPFGEHYGYLTGG